ncbi:MAG: hypothetical protein ABSF63_02155 [Candidatus Bathyarchaeia archaeon]
MTSIFTVSREDLYDYRRCPKIVAIKAYRTIRISREAAQIQERRIAEPATIGKIGEAAVKLSLQGIPKHEVMKQIAHSIPEVRVNEYLAQIAAQSVEGMDEIRKSLKGAYKAVTIVGRGEGRHPDLAGTARPDFIALTEPNGTPIIVEAKDSTKTTPAYKFQAMFYNGIAEQFGVYILRERLEGESPKFSPRLIKSAAETILVYPRLATFSVVKEKYIPTLSVIKDVWKAKELGFSGQVPETECRKKCIHNRLKVDLPVGNMEPLPPLPLIFSKGSLEKGLDLDLEYQAEYAWDLLPTRIKLAVLFSREIGLGTLTELKDWLVKNLGITEEAADIVLDHKKRESFLDSKPDTDELLELMANELEPWEALLKERIAASGPAILARATAVYSLPKESRRFVGEAWGRWR